jgi:acyl carrier protein
MLRGMESTAQQVKRALVEVLDLAVDAGQIAEEDLLFGPPIRLDSLGYHRLMVGLEDRLGVRWTDAELDEAIFETVADLVAFVAAHSDRGRDD